MKTYEYDYVDKQIDYLNREMVRRFRTLKSLLTLDEINIIGEIGKVYRELAVLVRQVFLKIARYYYRDMWESERRYTEWLDEQWIEDVLTGYDPVSKYVFSNEEDRKRARLVEAVMGSPNKTQEIDPAMKSLALMYKVYSVRVADEAAVQSLKDQGVEMVEWIAELDDRTCNVCIKRDGNVYPLENVPPKPHINCRCTLRSAYGKIDYTSVRNGRGDS